MQLSAIKEKLRTCFGWLALFVIVGFFIGYAVASSEQDFSVASSRAGVVSVMFDYGNGVIEVYADSELAADETLFSLTRRVAQENNIPFAYKDHGALGVFVTQIGEAVPPSDAYWQYWVNNQYGQVGADAYAVTPGDVISWKLTAHKEP